MVKAGPNCQRLLYQLLQ